MRGINYTTVCGFHPLQAVLLSFLLRAIEISSRINVDLIINPGG